MDSYQTWWDFGEGLAQAPHAVAGCLGKESGVLGPQNVEQKEGSSRASASTSLLGLGGAGLEEEQSGSSKPGSPGGLGPRVFMLRPSVLFISVLPGSDS